VIVNFDAIHGEPAFTKVDIDSLVKVWLMFADDKGSQIDSIWWNWGEGHQAPYPSKILPLYDHPGYRKWVDQGIDIMRVFLDETKKRKLEVFYTYRINGSDQDLGPARKIPMKEAHPDWLIHVPWHSEGFWNFAVQGVRDYKLSILREAAENYDFDGIELDFARLPVLFPLGQQWENRDRLTEFLQAVRSMTLQVEEKRGRPFLLAARIAENLEGCHLDGIDVETWADEQLVDILVLGCRSYDVEVGDFRRITAGTPIKLYPCGLDAYHDSDGYHWPPIEVLRGVSANWWQQGVDGIYTFNWNYAPHEEARRLGLAGAPHFAELGPIQRQLYQEIGSSKTLLHKNKIFVVQRRGGGFRPRTPEFVPSPENWTTPRTMYANTNMFGPLPARMANDGKADTLLTIYVGDDVAGDAARIERISLRILLSDPGAEALPQDKRIGRATIRIRYWREKDFLYNFPPAQGIENRIEVRLNNALLGHPSIEHGWLLFTPRPQQFALGKNLLSLRLTERLPAAPEEILIEKVELHLNYS
jgi:hypothetical protein